MSISVEMVLIQLFGTIQLMAQAPKRLKNSAIVVRLDPGLAQRRFFSGAAGARRFAHNWAVARIGENAQQWRAERDAGVDPKSRIRPATLVALGNLWRAERADTAAWYAQYPSELYNFAFRDAVAAHRNFLSGRARFPKFKSKHRTPPAFSVCFTVRLEPGVLALSRVGAVRISAPDTHQADLRRRVRRGRSRITSARIYFRHNHWWAALAVETEAGTSHPRTPPVGPAVGVDLGLRTQAVVAGSDGEPRRVVTGEKHYRQGLAKTQRLSRVVSRRQRGSGRYHRALRHLRSHQGSTARRRAADMHSVTKELASTYPVICVEDLAVGAIVRSPRLGAATLDQALGELRRQLTYKAEHYGSRLIVADRFYPSSKTCAHCRAVKAKLPLSVRTYSCEHCGSVLDRDANAAANLALWGEAVLVTEAMARLCGHGTCSGDPDRPGPSATRPRVKGSKVNTSHACGEGSAGQMDCPPGETALCEAGSGLQLVCT
jgi:putative transposase